MAIETGLRDGPENRPARAKKLKPSDLDRAEGKAASTADPLGRLTAGLVEHAVSKLGEADEEALDYVGAVLRGLERLDMEEPQWDGLVMRLFEETIAGLLRCPELPAGDPEFLGLSEAVAAGLATELKSVLSSDPRPEVGESALRRLSALLPSLLRHAGEALAHSSSLRAAAPERRDELARGLSAVLTAVCLDTTESGRAGALLTQPPLLDRLLRALWGLVSDFPGAFAEGATVGWWRDVLAELSRPRRDQSAYEPDLVAEAVILVVERGAVDFTALARNPSNKHLFLTSTLRGLLEVMAEPMGEESKARMVDRFGRSELCVVMEAVVGAWIERPEWLFRKPAQQEKAATLLPVLVEALASLDEGSLKALLRHQRLQRVLVAALLSTLNSKLSSLSGRRIASVLIPVLAELVALGVAGWGILLEQDRLTDLLTAISKSKIEEKLFSEDAEEARSAARAIAVVAQELRSGRFVPLGELIERLNKGK